MPDDPLRQIVFLLKYNDSDLVHTHDRLQWDIDHWPGDEDPVFMPVTGAYDMVVLAKGTQDDAFAYTVWLQRTERYAVMATLTVHTCDELGTAADPHVDPKKR